MVDFNNETTVGTPASDIVRVLILQARYNLFEAWEAYIKQLDQGRQADLSIVRARLTTLFMELQAGLKRRLPKKEYDQIEALVTSTDLKHTEVFHLICQFNELLDKINLIKIDTKKDYDSSRVELEHKATNL